MSLSTMYRMLTLSVFFLLSHFSTDAQPMDGKIVTEKMKEFIQCTTPKNTGWTYYLNMPFPFQYDGIDVPQLTISRHGVVYMTRRTGWIRINRAPGLEPLYVTPYSSSGLSNSGDQGALRFQLDGSAPNRILIIQWDNYCLSTWPATLVNKKVNFEMILFETSNNIEFRYGDMKNAGHSWGTWSWENREGWAYFSGQDKDKWINIEPAPKSKFYFGKDDPKKNERYIVEKTAPFLPKDKTYILSKPEPQIIDMTPKDMAVWTVGSAYAAPEIKIEREANQPEITIEYKIYNKFDKEVIYHATTEGDVDSKVITPTPQPVGEPAIYHITHSAGIASKSDPAAPNSAVNDGSIVLPSGKGLKGGEYMVETTLHIPSKNKTFKKEKTLIIAMERDIAISQVLDPRPKERTKYVMNSVMPMEIKVHNYGIQDVSAIRVTANVYSMTNQLVYGPVSKSKDLSALPLKTGDYSTVKLNNMPTTLPNITPGFYKVTYEVELLGNTDVALANNVFPRAGDPDYIVQVVNDVDVSTDAILAPSGNINIGRPVKPLIKFTNHGVNDLAEVPVKVKIIGPQPATTVAYEKTLVIESLQAGNLNTSSVTFNEVFIPAVKGVYEIFVDVDAPQDKVLSNDTKSMTFTVVDAMTGTYTIGQSGSGTNNFPTISAAVDKLFERGISAPVTFEFTDPVYNVGDLADKQAPALDLSSAIIGASQNNTITFKASTALAVSKGGVTINLNSGNGVGVLIGQSIVPTNSNAAVYSVNDQMKKDFANSTGYFIFDGGSQQALRFVVNSTEEFRAAFYFSTGASNNTIKNCLIEGGQNPSLLASLPLMTYNPGRGAYIYEPNVRAKGATYTSGIVMRSTAPMDIATQSNNQYRLDTLSNNNNTISGNEISGFAYGIASMGTGVLYKSGGTNKNILYYNSNNTIENNEIHDVAKAGIFVGFERNSSIKNNRIYDINANAKNSAAGIIVGGQAARGFFGYNTIGIKVNANEINDITSDESATGILVEQSANLIPESGQLVLYPKVNENTTVSNNIIWRLFAENADANRYGIHLQTERKSASEFLLPKHTKYNTRNDFILNNTVVINGDADLANKGIVTGIAINETRNTVVKNNAIAIYDNSVAPECIANAALTIRNPEASISGLVSDHNVYWTSPKATVVRFSETGANNILIQNGTYNEYKFLAQWSNWTKQDAHSVYSNFMDDMTFVGNSPRSLRMKSNPSPLGSVLNNRGEILANVNDDIIGTSRGIAGQRFDIGAIEFNGRMSIDDVEALSIIEPASYQSTDNKFSDAQYIMTTPKVDVIARLRNNGSLFQTGTEATVNIYMESPQGTYTTPIVTKKATFDIVEGEYIDLNFNLVRDKNFTPKTYSELRNVPAYVSAVPEQFKQMTANVTPRYRIEIVLDNDQNPNNNTIRKDVRFFVQKSWLSMLVSSENAGQEITATSPKNTIAGNLNNQAVVDGLNTIGWKIDISGANLADDRHDFDLLDRNNWDARGIDYSLYRTLVWSDGHDVSSINGKDVNNELTRLQQLDVAKYLADGKVNDKKTLLVASQEMVRNNTDFSADILRANNRPVADPDVIDYSSITGESIGRNLKNKIKATTFTGDVNPMPALVNLNQDGKGISKLAYYYTSVKAGSTVLPKEEKIMGIATTTIGSNRAYLGTDWRHFGDIEQVLRQVFDFIETNGGVVFAVELLDFSAEAVGQRVNLAWETATENNSSAFEIERSLVNEAGSSFFTSIDKVQAAGNSISALNYNATDFDVTAGLSYDYRLKMIDNDGAIEYSSVKRVEVAADGISISPVSPNPVRSTSYFTVTLEESLNVEVSLFDIAGTKVLAINNGMLNKGLNNFKISASNLPSGSYTLVIRSGNQVETRTVTIVK